jgi:hypothetical protein
MNSASTRKTTAGRSKRVDVLSYLADLSRLSGTGKKKNTFNRLADEHMEFFSKMSKLPPPRPVPISRSGAKPSAIRNQQRMLNHIASASLPLLYTAMLQQFLRQFGISWPEKVFRHDMTSPGSGRHRTLTGLRAAVLKESGLGWSAIAKALFPEDYKANQKMARDRVRLAAKPYRQQLK